MITVAIVEDHKIFVDALTLVLHSEKDIELAGFAATLKDSYALIRRTRPDVVLLEIDLPDGDGLSLVPKIKSWSPDTKIIILTRLADDMALMRAVDIGVCGFLSKSCSLSDLLVTIRRAQNGEVVMPSHRLAELLRRFSRERSVGYKDGFVWERLTPREQEVLNCLARGKSGDLIAQELNITPLTVRTHIRNLMSKLGAHSRLEAVSVAASNGLIDWPA